MPEIREKNTPFKLIQGGIMIPMGREILWPIMIYGFIDIFHEIL
jgi:hypothetical protein